VVVKCLDDSSVMEVGLRAVEMRRRMRLSMVRAIMIVMKRMMIM